MIDCMLFILVFYYFLRLLVSKAIINLTLPDAQGVPPKQFDHKIEIMVDSTGHYSVNGQALSTKDSADLSTAIKQAAQDRRDFMFIIAADAKAKHEDVIRVMDVAGQLGFVNVNISTKVPTRGFTE